MRNIEKAIAAYKARHDSRRDLSAQEMAFFLDRINGGEGAMETIYNVFRFAFVYGYKAGKEDARKARKA